MWIRELAQRESDASAALREAHGFEMQGSIVQGRERLTLNLAAAPSSSDLRISIGTTSFELIQQRTGDFVRIDVCNQGKADSAHGTLTLSHFGQVPTIAAPPDPLELAQPPSI